MSNQHIVFFDKQDIYGSGSKHGGQATRKRNGHNLQDEKVMCLHSHSSTRFGILFCFHQENLNKIISRYISQANVPLKPNSKPKRSVETIPCWHLLFFLQHEFKKKILYLQQNTYT